MLLRVASTLPTRNIPACIRTQRLTAFPSPLGHLPDEPLAAALPRGRKPLAAGREIY